MLKASRRVILRKDGSDNSPQEKKSKFLFSHFSGKLCWPSTFMYVQATMDIYI